MTTVDPVLPGIVCGFPWRLIGIDAGGSSTRVAAIDAGHLVELPVAEPINALMTAELDEILSSIIEQSGASVAGIGVPGIRSTREARALGERLQSRTGCRVYATSDVEAVRLGAFLGNPGIVVAAGTGTNAFGSNGKRSAGAGGHGFIVGDEGSAYWIGREAVRSALRWKDHMGGSERIYRSILEFTGIGLGELVKEITANPSQRNRLTVLAPAVTSLVSDDPEAHRITEEAVTHLVTLVDTLRAQLGPLPVAGVGGVFSASAVWDAFAARTGASRPMAPPVVGAAILAAAAERARGA